MVSVPGFLLRRLYQKGSLKNTETGFEFLLANRLGSGYAHGMLPITVDGDEVELSDAAFVLDGVVTPFDSISRDSTYTLSMNKTIIVRVEGSALPPGAHTIGMGFEVPGLGALRFDFSDVVE